MDGHGFDLLTKRLARLITRRQGLRVVLAGAGAAGLLGLKEEDAGAACGGAGTRCVNGSRCCSSICLRGRKKKGKKGRKKGRCDCSFPQEACNVGNDCCFPGSDCADNGCDPDNRCCFGEGAECIDPCECCTGFTCLFESETAEFGLCVPCKALQEPCSVGDVCCETNFCASNGGGQGNVCCMGTGGDCADDLDCCGTRRCSSRVDNTCQSCPGLGETCNPQVNTCCHKDAKCFDNADGANNVCCLDEGAACQETSDCCEDHFCHPTAKTCQFDLGRSGPESASATIPAVAKHASAEQGRRRAKSRRSRKTSHQRRRRR